MSRETLIAALTENLPVEQHETVKKGANILLDRIYTNFLLDIINPDSDLNTQIRNAIVFNKLSTLDYDGDEIRNSDPDSKLVTDAFDATTEAFATALMEVLALYGFATESQTTVVQLSRMILNPETSLLVAEGA